MLLACTNWRSLDSIGRLEADLNRPAISTSQVSLWAVLRMLGYSGSLPGYGSLFGRSLPKTQ